MANEALHEYALWQISLQRQAQLYSNENNSVSCTNGFEASVSSRNQRNWIKPDYQVLKTFSYQQQQLIKSITGSQRIASQNNSNQ